MGPVYLVFFMFIAWTVAIFIASSGNLGLTVTASAWPFLICAWVMTKRCRKIDEEMRR